MIKQDVIDKLLVSKIPKDFDCDRFFPEIPSHFKLTSETEMLTEDGTKINVCNYENSKKC
jgi:dihydrofolate reductase